MKKRHLTLAGAGHSHLEVLRRLVLEPIEGLSVTLVSAGPFHHYSGMVPGYLGGAYREEEIAFALEPLVDRLGGQFIAARVVGLDAAQRRLILEDTGTGPSYLDYDLLSFNLGSRLVGAEDPAIRRHAALVKPMSRAVELRRRLDELAAGSDSALPARIVVVGAGAAGFEVACAAAAILDRAGRANEVTLVETGDEILSSYGPEIRRRATQVLEDQGIEVLYRTRVETLEEGRVIFQEGQPRDSDLTIWLTGAAAPGVFEESGLPVDERGFLCVNEALRSPADERVFAVGDCACLEFAPQTPKAGVYAVREGPVLWQSLRASLGLDATPAYAPQSDFLSILNTSDGKALLRYKGLVSYSAWAWKLKDWIDRRFMEKYFRIGARPAQNSEDKDNKKDKIEGQTLDSRASATS